MSTDMCSTLMAKMLDQDDAPAWYESDLQLAAALGKKLLENNMELEETIRMHEATIQKQEYDMLDITTRHAKSIQENNNQHNQMLEQLENIIAESEADKETLKLEKAESYKKAEKLREEVEFWKMQYQAAQDKIEQLSSHVSANYGRQLRIKESDDGQNSYDDEEDDHDHENNLVGKKSARTLIDMRCEQIVRETEDDTAQLLKNIHALETRYKQEQRRCGILETEMTQISMEKQFLQEQLDLLKEEHQFSRSLQSELTAAELKERECPNCKLKISFPQEDHNEAHDVPISPLSSGLDGSTELYGSQESLCSADRMSGEINNNKHKFVKRPSLLNELLNHGDVDTITCVNTTPVTEFATQCIESVCVNKEEEWNVVANSSFYTTLFEDFGSKINVASKRSTTAVQTDERLISYDLEPTENPFRDRFHKTPEYKSLFQEIYAVLKRKVGGVVAPRKEVIPLEML